jgi:hypothetical protein
MEGTDIALVVATASRYYASHPQGPHQTERRNQCDVVAEPLRPNELMNEIELLIQSFPFSVAVSQSVKTGKAPCGHMFSALPPKADITLRTRYVRFVPTADNA